MNRSLKEVSRSIGDAVTTPIAFAVRNTLHAYRALCAHLSQLPTGLRIAMICTIATVLLNAFWPQNALMILSGAAALIMALVSLKEFFA